MKNPLFRSLVVTLGMLAILGTAGRAAGAIICPDLPREKPASIVGICGPGANSGIPLDSPFHVRKINSNDIQPASGSLNPSSVSTSSIGQGPAALVSFLHFFAPPLVAGLLREAKLVLPIGPPFELLHVPRS